MIFLNDLKFFIPELFLFISLLLMIVYGVFYNSDTPYSKIHNSSLGGVVLAILILAITGILFTLQPQVNFVTFECQLSTSFINYFSKLFIIIIMVNILIFTYNYFKWETLKAIEVPILMLASLLGMFIVINANDFISVYMGIELQTLSFYVLTASKKYSNISAEAGIKYFVLGSLASAFLLFGVTIFYGYTGTTNFSDMSLLFVNEPIEISASVYLSIIFITSGLLFKLPAAPLHNWAPDVYSGASSIITAFFALVPKLAIITFLIRFFYINLFAFFAYWSVIFVIFGVISLTVGCLGALYQTKIKRFIAYSTINHIGFTLLSLSTGTVDGIFSSFFYIIVYTIMNITIFACILNIRRSFGVKIEYLEDFSAIYKTNPIVGIGITIIFFSMAGIPPVIGFFSKFYVINSLIKSFMYGPAIIAVLVSVISCLYYIRVIKYTYFSTYFYRWKNVNSFTYETGFLFSFSTLVAVTVPIFLNSFNLVLETIVLQIIVLLLNLIKTWRSG